MLIHCLCLSAASFVRPKKSLIIFNLLQGALRFVSHEIGYSGTFTTEHGTLHLTFFCIHSDTPAIPSRLYQLT